MSSPADGRGREFSPGAAGPAAAAAVGSPAGSAAGPCGGICFAVLAALHAVVFSFAPADRWRPAVEPAAELSLVFEAFDRPPAAEAPPRPEPPPAAEAVTEAAVTEAAAAEAAVTESAVTEGAAVPAAVPGNAAPGVTTGNGVTAGGAGAAADYLALIMRRLEEKKVYPLAVRKRGIEGDVTVRFTIGRNGAVTGITLEAAAHRFLGQAAVETVKSAAPFPVPAGAAAGREEQYPVRVTIRYRLEDE
ncbi:MAG: energy transducer TonB [Treponema sp.]|jgi:TonB family protein|nr:energy transducer TonB [Treponema sp.]